MFVVAWLSLALVASIVTATTDLPEPAAGFLVLLGAVLITIWARQGRNESASVGLHASGSPGSSSAPDSAKVMQEAMQEIRRLSANDGPREPLHDGNGVLERAAVLVRKFGSSHEVQTQLTQSMTTVITELIRQEKLAVDEVRTLMGLPDEVPTTSVYSLGALASQLVFSRPEFGPDGMFALEMVPVERRPMLSAWYVTLVIRVERLGRIEPQTNLL